MRSDSRLTLPRRDFLKGSLLGGASVLTSGLVACATHPTPSSAQPVVRTAAGKIRGAVIDGVNTFKGIPYGASTAGPNRFLPPQRAVSWDGVREASEYGAMTIQHPMTDQTYERVLHGLYPAALSRTQPPLFDMSEDCLFLNVWSPELGSGHKRPVMVWLHPGAFASWAGDSQWTDGANLARKHDVVFVSLNHRLNIFGYLYLGELGGSKYGESGNAGMLDIVAALGWIQENIGRFGGDPDNVTLLGESGGGYKVSVLLAMPAAKGLFHKAIVSSSAWNRTTTVDQGTAAARAVLGRLAISPGNVDELQQLPPDKILAALRDDLLYPVVAGTALPRQPFEPDAPEISRSVPLLIGLNQDEWAYSTIGDTPPQITDTASVRRALVNRHWRLGVTEVEADGFIGSVRAQHPTMSPLELYAKVYTNIIRDEILIQAERKAAQAGAPVYMYQFNWKSPAFEGRYGSCHTFDLPFVFDNVDAASQLYGTDPDPRRYELATRMSGAWTAFAHTGTPGHPSLPRWEPYSVRDRATMLFDYSCELVSDPQKEYRVAFEQLRAARVTKSTTWRTSVSNG